VADELGGICCDRVARIPIEVSSCVRKAMKSAKERAQATNFQGTSMKWVDRHRGSPPFSTSVLMIYSAEKVCRYLCAYIVSVGSTSFMLYHLHIVALGQLAVLGIFALSNLCLQIDASPKSCI
jgi:hypothetical protein